MKSELLKSGLYQQGELVDTSVVDRIRAMLEIAQAPITGRRVGVSLQTPEGWEALGFNTETVDKITHAEDRAVSFLPRETVLSSVHLVASGIPSNIKHALPCENCTHLLSSYSTCDTSVNLYFHQREGVFSLPFQKIKDSYSSFPSVNAIPEDVESFLEQETVLTPVDRRLITDMVGNFQHYNQETGENSSEIFITGSASGRGGPKGLLAKEITGVGYMDVDLILLFPNGTNLDIDAYIKSQYLQILGRLGFGIGGVESVQVPSYILELGRTDSPDFIFRREYSALGLESQLDPKTHQKNPHTPSSLDVSVGKSLESTITPDYLRRNWYLRLL